MVRAETSQVDELAPEQAFQALTGTTASTMVDVRTNAERAFTGLPDLRTVDRPLWPIQWVKFPDMAPNASFREELLEHAGGEVPERLFFICRAGGRSMAAARRVAEQAEAIGQPVHCTNVAEGFEGDLDEEHHRGTRNGWKAKGLPWRQS